MALCEKQNGCCSTQLWFLNRMRNLAATKRVINLKQKKKSAITILPVLIICNKPLCMYTLQCTVSVAHTSQLSGLGRSVWQQDEFG